MKVAMLGVKAVPAIGGIAAYTEEVGSRLAARGHEVVVYCRPRYLGPGSSGHYRGMERRITWGISSKYLDALTHTASALAAARRSGFDVLHFHGVGPAALVPLARGSGGAKVVVTVHGFEWQSQKWGRAARACLQAADRFCLRAADAITVVSEAMLARYRSGDGRPVLFIPTGVARPQLRPPRRIREWGLAGDDYLLFLGRLVPEKGCDLLLEAYRQAATDLRLVIAGEALHDAGYAARLRAQADARVIFAGYVQGELKEELLSNAYLFVQPSRLEGLPVAVLEAMSYGRYVLASDLPSNREAMDGSGLFFRTGDREHLRERLEYCLQAKEVVTAGRASVAARVCRERDWDRTVGMLEQLYLSLVRGQGAPPQSP
jgi:glycosyltransferase involved in cell wall biosynthesis